MAEKKLSEELRHCLKSDNCYGCKHYDEETVVTCPRLLQKAYEVVKRYEEMFPCKVGDIVYFIKSSFSYLQKPKEEKIRKIELYSSEIIFRTQERSFGVDKIGETVFLTRQEAEDKLAEMEEKNRG